MFSKFVPLKRLFIAKLTKLFLKKQYYQGQFNGGGNLLTFNKLHIKKNSTQNSNKIGKRILKMHFPFGNSYNSKWVYPQMFYIKNFTPAKYVRGAVGP